MNLLAAWFVVADFYELDTVDISTLHPNCKAEESLGSSTINFRGEYSLTSSIVDDVCGADGDTVPDIGVRFRLRYCNPDKRCFSVEDDNQNNYRLWSHNAQPSAPLRGTAGTHVLVDGTFQAAPYDDFAKAVNLYAGIVEATNVWHLQTDVSFFEGGEDELFVRFPSSTVTVPSTTSGHQIHHPQVDEWIVGGSHEFGHVLHNRAWEGTTGDCGDCPGGKYERNGQASWSAISQEYPHTALVEGWANFASRVVEHWPDGCGESFDETVDAPICSADTNEYPNTSNPVTHPEDGKSYARNVTKLLCDWYDTGLHNDDDPNMAGAGDHFVANLQSVWSNLDTMWDWKNGAAGLSICDYIDYYLNERKNATNVGSISHDDYVSWITDLAFNNGIQCDLAAPSGGASRVSTLVDSELALCAPDQPCGDARPARKPSLGGRVDPEPWDR
jgi:hypothetical protein